MTLKAKAFVVVTPGDTSLRAGLKTTLGVRLPLDSQFAACCRAILDFLRSLRGELPNLFCTR